MRWKRILGTAAALILGAGLFYFYGGHQAPSTQAPLVDLAPENLSTLKNAFNEAKGDVRLLVLLSPS